MESLQEGIQVLIEDLKSSLSFSKAEALWSMRGEHDSPGEDLVGRGAGGGREG